MHKRSCKYKSHYTGVSSLHAHGCARHTIIPWRHLFHWLYHSSLWQSLVFSPSLVVQGREEMGELMLRATIVFTAIRSQLQLYNFWRTYTNGCIRVWCSWYHRGHIHPLPAIYPKSTQGNPCMWSSMVPWRDQFSLGVDFCECLRAVLFHCLSTRLTKSFCLDGVGRSYSSKPETSFARVTASFVFSPSSSGATDAMTCVANELLCLLPHPLFAPSALGGSVETTSRQLTLLCADRASSPKLLASSPSVRCCGVSGSAMKTPSGVKGSIAPYLKYMIASY